LKVLARNKAMQQARNNRRENVLQTGAPVLQAQQPSAHTEFLTIKDLPDLKGRLEAQGWMVKRVGDELICKPRRPWHRIQ
jgi:hypothetical protein